MLYTRHLSYLTMNYFFSDGVKRTGVFCTIANLIDRLEFEQRVDVFRAAKDVGDAGLCYFSSLVASLISDLQKLNSFEHTSIFFFSIIFAILSFSVTCDRTKFNQYYGRNFMPIKYKFPTIRHIRITS